MLKMINVKKKVIIIIYLPLILIARFDLAVMCGVGGSILLFVRLHLRSGTYVGNPIRWWNKGNLENVVNYEDGQKPTFFRPTYLLAERLLNSLLRK